MRLARLGLVVQRLSPLNYTLAAGLTLAATKISSSTFKNAWFLCISPYHAVNFGLPLKASNPLRPQKMVTMASVPARFQSPSEISEPPMNGPEMRPSMTSKYLERSATALSTASLGTLGVQKVLIDEPKARRGQPRREQRREIESQSIPSPRLSLSRRCSVRSVRFTHPKKRRHVQVHDPRNRRALGIGHRILQPKVGPFAVRIVEVLVDHVALVNHGLAVVQEQSRDLADGVVFLKRKGERKHVWV